MGPAVNGFILLVILFGCLIYIFGPGVGTALALVLVTLIVFT